VDTADKTIRLTTAQAIIRYLAAQYIDIDGEKTRVCGGGFGIFGHGNVPCLGEALYDHRDVLPLYRGQNEQGMGFAAAAYAKYHLRQKFMFCTASAGTRHGQSIDRSGLVPCQPPADADALRRYVFDPTARSSAATAWSILAIRRLGSMIVFKRFVAIGTGSPIRRR